MYSKGSKIEVIHEELIKPSSPTPSHLRKYELSFLDQTSPTFHGPFLFFYKGDFEYHHQRVQKMSQLLKQSLSIALTLYYPLAGRIIENDYVDCNDAGVVYKEAQVCDPNNVSLLKIITNPDVESLAHYLPNEPFFNANTKTIPLLVQTNFFPCGGTVVGICFSHKLGDATSIIAFLNTWAAFSRGAPPRTVDYPIFPLNRLSPHKDMADDTRTFSNTKHVARRFVFNEESLLVLKSKVIASGSMVKDPTRFEALAAFICNQVKKAVAKSSDNTRTVAGVGLAMNLRPKIVPPHSENSIGNFQRHANTIFSPDQGGDVVHLLRVIKEKFDTEYVKSILCQESNLADESLKARMAQMRNGEIEICSFTSLIHLPVYEVDFGWGKPDWVSKVAFPLRNYVILMRTRSGDGIEAWINLLPQDMAFLERDLDFLSVTAMNKSNAYSMPKL